MNSTAAIWDSMTDGWNIGIVICIIAICAIIGHALPTYTKNWTFSFANLDALEYNLFWLSAYILSVAVCLGFLLIIAKTKFKSDIWNVIFDLFLIVMTVICLLVSFIAADPIKKLFQLKAITTFDIQKLQKRYGTRWQDRTNVERLIRVLNAKDAQERRRFASQLADRPAEITDLFLDVAKTHIPLAFGQRYADFCDMLDNNVFAEKVQNTRRR